MSTDANDLCDVDALLEAIAAGDDAPAPGDEAPSVPVADLLRAAASDLEVVAGPTSDEVTVWRAALTGGAGAGQRRGRRLVPALVIGGWLLVGGAAAAANGSLPDPVQGVAHDLGDLVSLPVPDADESSEDQRAPTTDPPGGQRNRGEVEGVGSDGVPPGQGGGVPGAGAEAGSNGRGVGSERLHTSHGDYPVVANRFRPYGSVGSPETPQNLATQISTANTYASRVFHRWVRVCAVTLGSIGITSPGEYDLAFNSRVTASGTAGHNRFAVRAALGSIPASTAADGSNVAFFAAGPMPLYQNATASTAAFYLARVLPGSVNRILRLELFDTGDGGGSGTITIVPPPEYASSFAGCTASSSGSPQPSITSSCTLTGVAANTTYQGQRVQVSIPIPDNYDCNENTATGCWVRVRFNWSTGVQDTTTWRATIVGDPVRLTE